jgi:hypothetical protein
MKSPRALVLLLALLPSACASVPGPSQQQDPLPGSAPRAGRVTGMIGVTDITAIEVDLDSGIGEADSEDLTLPLIGAAYQFPNVSRTALEWGFEAGFGVGWDSEREAVVIDTGAVLVVADNDLRLIDLYGGLYAATKLGQKVRAYGGAGPVLQFGRADLDFDEPIDGSSSASESGVGYGYYTRAGLEYEFRRDTWIGLVARWSDTTLDLGGDIDELDLEAVQLALTVTTDL